jgi:hypothetical protein
MNFAYAFKAVAVNRAALAHPQDPMSAVTSIM